MRAPFGPPRLSLPRKVTAEAHAVVTSCEIDEAGGKNLGLQRFDVLVVDQFVIDGRDWILPDQLFLGNLRAEVARDRAHVAMGELEPRTCESVGQLVGMIEEVTRDLLVRRIDAQCEV